MNNALPSTSIDAYRRHQRNGTLRTHEDVVATALKEYGPCVASELAEHVPYDVVEVRRRLSGLKESNRAHMTDDRRENQYVWAYGPVETGQMEFM